MKQILVFASVLLFVPASYGADDKAIHPQPKEPALISKELLPTLKKSLTLPPAKNSDAQKADEKELLAQQSKRSSSDCVRAKSEVYVSLESFFGAPQGSLNKNEVIVLTGFFDQVRNDADYYIQLLKKEFPRQRPFLYIAGLKPCVPKEVTGAYPSGHAALAKLYGLILQDLLPEKAEALTERSKVIAMDRVLSGMHHPSDIKTGSELGELLYKEFKKSKIFQDMLSEEMKKLNNLKKLNS